MAKQQIFTLFGVSKNITQKMTVDIENIEIGKAVDEFVQSARALAEVHELPVAEKREVLEQIEAVESAKSSGEMAVKSSLERFMSSASKLSKPILSASLTAAASVVLQVLS